MLLFCCCTGGIEAEKEAQITKAQPTRCCQRHQEGARVVQRLHDIRWIHSVVPGEVEGASARQEPSSGTTSQNSTKWPSAGHLCAYFCPNPQKEAPLGWPEGHAWARPVFTASAVLPDWHLPENSRLSTGALFSPQRRAGSHWAHPTDVRLVTCPGWIPASHR